jgi:predicted lysophospholipase L1 biosynthesis ABC-type transport system permease subunit
VKNSIYEAFDEPPTPLIYLSYRDRPAATGEIHLRARPGADAAAAADLARVVRAIDPALPLYNPRTLDDHVEQNLVFQRIPARMFAVIGPLLLLLAAIGIAAVVAHGVSERRHELGVRLALGATARRVMLGIVAETMTVVATGAAAGWILAFVIDREVVRSTAFDAGRLVAVPLVLLVVAAVACWLPARASARIDPMAALRAR